MWPSVVHLEAALYTCTCMLNLNLTLGKMLYLQISSIQGAEIV